MPLVFSDNRLLSVRREQVNHNFVVNFYKLHLYPEIRVFCQFEYFVYNQADDSRLSIRPLEHSAGFPRRRLPICQNRAVQPIDQPLHVLLDLLLEYLRVCGRLVKYFIKRKAFLRRLKLLLQRWHQLNFIVLYVPRKIRFVFNQRSHSKQNLYILLHFVGYNILNIIFINIARLVLGKPIL